MLVKACMLGLGALLLVGCAADTADDSEDEAAGQVDEHLLAGRQLSPREVAGLLRDAGFPESVVPEMVCTASHESSFFERASHKNHNGTIDRGLFQINNINLGHAGCRASSTTIYDPAVNARCAKAIYEAQGLNAWYGYKSNRAECNAYRIP